MSSGGSAWAPFRSRIFRALWIAQFASNIGIEIDIDPDSGPVLVTVEWRIDPATAKEFREAMEPLRQARRQTGATRWGLFQDAEEPALFLETFTVDTWSEHLRQHLERGTVMDEQAEENARGYLVGEDPPRVRHLLWAKHGRRGA